MEISRLQYDLIDDQAMSNLIDLWAGIFPENFYLNKQLVIKFYNIKEGFYFTQYNNEIKYFWWLSESWEYLPVIFKIWWKDIGIFGGHSFMIIRNSKFFSLKVMNFLFGWGYPF